MTPLQSFKAACVKGARCVFTANWCPTPTIRTVTIVAGTKVAFTHPTRSGHSYLDWPKATAIQQPLPGLFKIHNEGFANELTYDFRHEVLALAVIVKITDGSQPIDQPGALMVAQTTLADSVNGGVR